MNCKNCGAELNEGSAFCGNCGMRVEEEQPVSEIPAEENVKGEYTAQEVYQEPVYEQCFSEPMVQAERPNTVRWIILSVVELLICCQLTGIIGLIFSIIGHISAEKGDFEDALKKIKIAKTTLIIGAIFGAIVLLFFLGVFIFGFLTGLTEEVLYY